MTRPGWPERRDMADWAILLFGIALLGLVGWDARNIRAAWDRPARWWSATEYMDSRRPSQPLNLLLGLLLGLAAITYGLVALLD